jgi:hypothetical protein
VGFTDCGRACGARRLPRPKGRPRNPIAVLGTDSAAGALSEPGRVVRCAPTPAGLESFPPLAASRCQVLFRSLLPLAAPGDTNDSLLGRPKNDTPLPKYKQGAVLAAANPRISRRGVDRLSSRLMQESHERRNIFVSNIPASRIARLLNAVPKWPTVEDYHHA